LPVEALLLPLRMPLFCSFEIIALVGCGIAVTPFFVPMGACCLSYAALALQGFGSSLFVNSALAELRCATGGFEAVLLSVLRAKTVDFTGFFRFSRLG